MNDVITQELLLDALDSAGLHDAHSARKMIAATLGELSRRLTKDERATLSRCLGAELRGLIPSGGDGQGFDADALYRAVARRTRASAGVAREQAQVILEAIGRHAPYETLRRLEHALPPELAALFAERELGEPAPYVETFPAAQAHSVVREANPHGGRKLSSGRPELRPSDAARGRR